MKKSIGILAAVLTLLLAANCALAEDLFSAYDFNLEDIDGKQVSLSSLKEKAGAVLLFWTTWCPYCRAELKQLDASSGQFAKDKVEVLAINVNESPALVAKYVKDHQLGLRVLLDKDAKTANTYGIFGVPTYIYIDKESKIAYLGNSFSPEKYNKLFSK